MIQPSVSVNWLLEVKLLSSYREWAIGALSFLMSTIQGDGSQSLRKTFVCFNIGKRLEEDLRLKKVVNKFTIASFLK